MTDSTKNALALTPRTPDLATLAPLVERAQAYAESAKASATVRAYERDWMRFEAWCATTRARSLPARPATVGVYLAFLADNGKRVSTIERALAAIAHAHRAHGEEWTKGERAIREVLCGIRRRVGVALRKKAPIVDADLRAVVGALPVGLIGVRDRALLTLAWCGAFRRSEVVALKVKDVTFSSEGVIVTLRRSKTDQEGHGAEKGIPFASDPNVCPVRALRAWLDIGAIRDGSIFRAVSRGERVGAALGDRAVARIVKRAAKRAGLDPDRYAGHSLRSGFATTAAMKGRSLDAIMRQTGHRSERVARGYIRHATLFVDNAAKDLL